MKESGNFSSNNANDTSLDNKKADSIVFIGEKKENVVKEEPIIDEPVINIPPEIEEPQPELVINSSDVEEVKKEKIESIPSVEMLKKPKKEVDMNINQPQKENNIPSVNINIEQSQPKVEVVTPNVDVNVQPEVINTPLVEEPQKINTPANTNIPPQPELVIETVSVDNAIEESKAIEAKKEKIEDNKISPEKPKEIDNMPLKEINEEESYFDGKMLELLAYNFLLNFISALTVNIARPFIKNLVLEYEINHTVINGRRLKYHSRSIDYFVENFKWTFLTIITFGIYAFWIPIKKQRYIDSHISYEDEELIQGASYFDGSFFGILGMNALCIIISLITFGLGYPAAKCMRERWLQKHRIISNDRFAFDGKGIALFGQYIIWILLTIVTLGIYSLWLPVKVKEWFVKHTYVNNVEVSEKGGKVLGIIAIIIVVIILLFSIPVIMQNLPDIIDSIDFPQKIIPPFMLDTL